MRRISWLLIPFAIACLHASPALSQAKKDDRPAPKVSDRPKLAQIDHNGVLILVRSTLLALHHANKTGDYAVLRELGAPDFQSNNPARLSEIFAKQRNDGLDLSGVAVLEPQLTLGPQIEANGMLHLAGFFPSAAMQLNFELAFAPVDREWKVSGMSVRIGPSAPTAPDGPRPATPAISTEPPESPAANITTTQQRKKK